MSIAFFVYPQGLLQYSKLDGESEAKLNGLTNGIVSLMYMDAGKDPGHLGRE
jgi:hypothetical protein